MTAPGAVQSQSMRDVVHATERYFIYLSGIGRRDEVIEELLLQLKQLLKGEVWRGCVDVVVIGWGLPGWVGCRCKGSRSQDEDWCHLDHHA